MGWFTQNEKLSSFTHPEVVPTCMSFFLLLNTKEDILKNVDNQHFCWYPLTSICIQQKKEIHTDLEQHVGE